MDAFSDRPLVIWIASCFDKRRENPFPVYNRCLVLDWSGLSAEETEEVRGILSEANRSSKHAPIGFDSAVVTVSRGSRQPDRRIVKFRRHFRVVSDEEKALLFSEAESGRTTTLVRPDGEYFEDETGKEMNNYEMIQHVTGQENPILRGDAKSVTRLGPTAPTAVEEWNVKTANTIAQFLDVIERICDSAWYRSPQSITFEVAKASVAFNGDRSRLLEAEFPNHEETSAVLAYFRQLHGGDKLLVNAVDCYLKHCSDARKRLWVQERKEAFADVVDNPPAPLEANYTCRRVIQMFMYGAGLLHSTSNDGAEKDLEKLIGDKGVERATALFNHCLLDLLSVAISVYQVIKQDFMHWFADYDLPEPDEQLSIVVF